MKKNGRIVKLIGAAAASLIFLITLAACGQPSASSPKKQQTNSNNVKSTNTSKASSSSSNSSNGSSNGSPQTSSTPTSPSSTSEASSMPTSVVPWYTSVIQSENQSVDLFTASETGIDYVLAYIKLKGGINKVNSSTFLLDNMLIGSQGSEKEWNSYGSAPMYQAHVDSSSDKVTLTLYNAIFTETEQEWSYNLANLINEYYSTQSQQQEVNDLLCRGEFNEIVNLAAYIRMWSANVGQNGATQFAPSLLSITGNAMRDTGSAVSYMTLQGNNVDVTTYPGVGMPLSTSSYPIKSLINEYYSTSHWRSMLNSYINSSSSAA